MLHKRSQVMHILIFSWKQGTGSAWYQSLRQKSTPINSTPGESKHGQLRKYVNTCKYSREMLHIPDPTENKITCVEDQHKVHATSMSHS